MNTRLRQRHNAVKNAEKPMDSVAHPTDEASTSAATISSGKTRKVANNSNQTTRTAQAEKRKQEMIANPTNSSLMAKIVDYLKKQHLNSQRCALSLSNILKEMQQREISKRTEEWLMNALCANPRIIVKNDGKFVYNPPYDIKDRSSIINILRQNHIDGKGGLLLSELNDCISGADEIMKSFGNKVIAITGQYNKRKDVAYFYNDVAADCKVDSESCQQRVPKRRWTKAETDRLKLTIRAVGEPQSLQDWQNIANTISKYDKQRTAEECHERAVKLHLLKNSTIKHRKSSDYFANNNDGDITLVETNLDDSLLSVLKTPTAPARFKRRPVLLRQIFDKSLHSDHLNADCTEDSLLAVVDH